MIKGSLCVFKDKNGKTHNISSTVFESQFGEELSNAIAERLLKMDEQNIDNKNKNKEEIELF